MSYGERPKYSQYTDTKKRSNPKSTQGRYQQSEFSSGGAYRDEGKFAELKRRAGLANVPSGVLVVIALLAIALVGYGAWSWWPTSPNGDMIPDVAFGLDDITEDSADESSTATSALPPATVPEQSAQFQVHVAGAVRVPGVYTLPCEARVGDAIEAAGGVTNEAEIRAVNFAALLTDGTQIIVPTVKEAQGSGFAVGGGAAASSQLGGGQAAGAPGASGMPGAVGGTGVSSTGLVNINTADESALQTLPGVGPSTATKIVADRQKNGPFKSPSDLQRVSGIGAKKMEALSGLISVN